MKKISLLLCLLSMAFLGFSQVKVVAPNGHTGVGPAFTTGGESPIVKLDVDGVIRSSDYATNANDYSMFDNENNGVRLNIAKSSPSSNSIIDINPLPLNGTSNSKFRFFRLTNTTGEVKFEVHYGDGSGGVNMELGGNTNTKLNKTFGNVLIGSGNPTAKLSVNGSANKPGGGTWGTFSDERLKKDVQDYTEGLAEVLLIKPVTFRYNGKAHVKDTDTEYVGVIAQDMQEISPRTVSEFEVYKERQVGDELTGTTERYDHETYLGYDGTAVTYMLVNAVKEQQKLINDLQARLAQLEGNTGSTLNDDSNYLGQNVPNPHNGFTEIGYSLPSTVQTSSIVLFDKLGRKVKEVELSPIAGKGSIDLEINDSPNGIYSYSLIVNNKVIQSKSMSVVK